MDYVIQSGIDRRLGPLQFSGFFDQRILRPFKAVKLSAQGLKEKQRTKHREQCAGTDSYCLNAPGRERRGFRHTDIDDKGVVAQRTYRSQPRFAINIIWQSVGSAA